MKTRVYGPSNDDIPADELTLAMLIQNVKAHGGHSCRGSFNDGANGYCAYGAMQLHADYYPVTPLMRGNDAADGSLLPTYADECYAKRWNVAAAYEVALRPRKRR